MDTADGDAVVVSDSDSSGSTNKFAGTESEATSPSSNRSGVTVDFELAYEIAQRELCHSCTWQHFLLWLWFEVLMCPLETSPTYISTYFNLQAFALRNERFYPPIQLTKAQLQHLAGWGPEMLQKSGTQAASHVSSVLPHVGKSIDHCETPRSYRRGAPDGQCQFGVDFDVRLWLGLP